MSGDGGTRTGRRPGANASRDAILQAARELFAERGYAGASLRAIAAQAGVDPALIRHFFGSKDALFAATLDLPDDVWSRLVEALAAGPAGVGERVSRAYLSLWEDPATSEPLRAIVASAVTNERATNRMREFVAVSVLRPALPYLPDDAPVVRLSLAMSHLLGVAIARHLLKAPPLATLDFGVLVTLVAPVVQGYLTEPLADSKLRDSQGFPQT